MKNFSCLFTGDVMTHGNQIRAAYDKANGSYDFSSYFHNILSHIKTADISVCNFESTIADGDPTGFPRFNTPEAIAAAISEAGFSCVAAANNHSYDSKLKGISSTCKALKKYGLKVIGISEKKDADKYAIMDANGVKVALLNYTFETAMINGNHSLNNIPMDQDAKRFLNSFSFESIEEDLASIHDTINTVRRQGAQVVIVYYHWGNEYDRHSNSFQKYIAWSTAKMGVDAIIGSHAHVPQEFDEISIETNGKVKKVPVFYGLGNYIWGAPPMQERETVLNSILAKLNISLNEETGEVTVTPSYVPLYISIVKNRFETIDLTAIDEHEYEQFKQTYGISVDEVLTQIKDTVNNKISTYKTNMHFSTLFSIKAGERLSLLNHFLPKGNYIEFKSEDAVIASVTQNGFVVANSAGYVGMSAIDDNGVETVFLVHVTEGEKSIFPILVNEHNLIRDIYLPPQLIKREEYGLTDDKKLCLPSADDWGRMLLAARNEGIYLECTGAFRTKKIQLLRRNKYSQRYGKAAASKRYQMHGRSEHNIGVALDVAGGKYNDKVTKKDVAILWVFKNCHKFGFIWRKPKVAISNIAYAHIYHVGDRDLAKYMSDNELSIENYLSDYDLHRKKIDDSLKWKNNMLPRGDSSEKLSIYKICHDILSIPVPKEFESISDRIITRVMLSDTVKIHPGSAFFFDSMLLGEMRRCRNALRSGAVVAFAKSQIYDEIGIPMPTIIVKDPLDACVKVGKYIMSHYSAKTICVTGSAGKSTTTELAYCVLNSKFKTHTCTVLNNANSRVWILEMLQRLKPEHQMYVQEVGGSFIKHIEKSAEMLQPDVAIITNIGEAHLDLYKTFDNIKADKLSLLENRKPGGLGLLNIDNEHLAARVALSSEGIKTYSIENPDADYFADNVLQTSEGLSLTVVEKNTGARTDITLRIVGRHNAYNILCAFAVGRWAGMSEKEIIHGLQSYQPKGIRQRLEKIGGYNLYIDCFSSVEFSLISSMQTLHEMVTPPNTKKIAVIYPLMRLGDQMDIISTRVAETVRDYDIDYIFIYGKEGFNFANEMNKGKINVIYMDDWYKMVLLIQQICRPGDTILFKGQHMQSAGLTIDATFGTDYYINYATERASNSIPFISDGFSGVIFHNVAGIIDKYSSSNKIVDIPETKNEKPVICINHSAFESLSVETVHTGNTLVSISKNAFKDCSQLREIIIGKSVRLIGESAFMNCTSLKKIELPRSMTHIEKLAFAGCTSLEEIIIPSNVSYIASDAFKGCPNLKIIAKPGSFADEFSTGKVNSSDKESTSLSDILGFIKRK